MSLQSYQLDSEKFLSTLGLDWQAALKKTDVTLELSTNIDMLLMVEKVNTDGIYNSVNKYVKVNNKYMKDYNKHKESSYLKYWL